MTEYAGYRGQLSWLQVLRSGIHNNPCRAQQILGPVSCFLSPENW